MILTWWCRLEMTREGESKWVACHATAWRLWVKVSELQCLQVMEMVEESEMRLPGQQRWPGLDLVQAQTQHGHNFSSCLPSV